MKGQFGTVYMTQWDSGAVSAGFFFIWGREQEDLMTRVGEKERGAVRIYSFFDFSHFPSGFASLFLAFISRDLIQATRHMEPERRN